MSTSKSDKANVSTMRFIANVLELQERSEPECLDYIFETLDTMAAYGNFIGADQILSCLDISALKIEIAIGFIAATHQFRNDLEEWGQYYLDLRKHLSQMNTPNAKELLAFWGENYGKR